MFKFFKSRLLLGIILYILCLQMPANSALEVKDAAKKIVNSLTPLVQTLASWIGDDNEVIEYAVERALEDKLHIVEELEKGIGPNYDHQKEILDTIDIFNEKYHLK